MAYSPIALVAPNYRDYTDYWLKAYAPATTTPKIMALDSGATITVAKVQLNADGFLKSAGGALVIPYIEGSYDLWLFPTEAEADANDTVNAEKLADNINALNESVINDLSLPYVFDTVAAYKGFSRAFPAGKVIQLKDRGAEFTVGTGTGNNENIIASDQVSQSIVYIEKEEIPSGEFGVLSESGNPPTDNTSAIANLISEAKSGKKSIKLDHGNILTDKVDLTDFNIGTLRGFGSDSTQFFARENVGSGAFVDMGLLDITASNIQFADVGGFSIRHNDKNIKYGVSYDTFRRSESSNIRVYGDDAVDRLENGFRINDSWNCSYDLLFSQGHYGNGFELGTESINAVTMMNPTASTQRPTATNFRFEGPNTVVLISPSSEGSPAKGFDFGSEVRSVTIINPHTEGDNGGFFKSGPSNNGMCLNIIGGASFNAENSLNFTSDFESFSLHGFTMYDVDDLADLVINLSARHNVITNLMVVENTTKTIATDKQIRDSIVLSSNVESCVINGVDIAKLYRREEFTITITPGSPIDLTSKYVDSMERRVCTLMASQRTSSAFIGHYNSIVTITEDGTINDDEISSRNGSSALVVGYNTSTNMLTIDSAVATNCRVILEHNKV